MKMICQSCKWKHTISNINQSEYPLDDPEYFCNHINKIVQINCSDYLNK